MANLEAVKRDILAESEDDYVGLWSVIKDVEEALPDDDETALRNHVLELLHDLLMRHQITAGFPTKTGRRFRSLNLGPEGILARIRADWPVGSRPTIGEGLWFSRAKKIPSDDTLKKRVPKKTRLQKRQ